MSDVLKFKSTPSETFAGVGVETSYTLKNVPNKILEITETDSDGTIAITSYTWNEGTNIVTLSAGNATTVTIKYEYWSGIPTVKGADGKSAYEYAVAGGFQGTESEFTALIGNIGSSDATKQNTIKVTSGKLLKSGGTGVVTEAVAGTDYLTGNGNAASATKLQTSRNVVIGSATRTFDGTANISYTVDEIGAAAKTHTQSADTITAGGLKGKVTANSTAVANLTEGQVRNIIIGNTDLVAGVSPLNSGDIYIYFEA